MLDVDDERLSSREEALALDAEAIETKQTSIPLTKFEPMTFAILVAFAPPAAISFPVRRAFAASSAGDYDLFVWALSYLCSAFFPESLTSDPRRKPLLLKADSATLIGERYDSLDSHEVRFLYIFNFFFL